MKTRLSVTSLPHCYPWAVVSTTYIRHRMKNVGMIWVSQPGICTCVNSTCSVKREQTSKISVTTGFTVTFCCKDNMELSQTEREKVHVLKKPVQRSGAPKDNFRKIIYSEDDLRSRIFGSFSDKFLACLPLLGFSNFKTIV